MAQPELLSLISRDPTCKSLSLDNQYSFTQALIVFSRQLTDVTPLLPALEKLTQLEILTLSGNKLGALPPDLSRMKTLRTFGLKNNPFVSVGDVVDSLKTLPQLRNLELNLSTNEEVQNVLISLPDLATLNGEGIVTS